MSHLSHCEFLHFITLNLMLMGIGEVEELCKIRHNCYLQVTKHHLLLLSIHIQCFNYLALFVWKPLLLLILKENPGDGDCMHEPNMTMIFNSFHTVYVWRLTGFLPLFCSVSIEGSCGYPISNFFPSSPVGGSSLACLEAEYLSDWTVFLWTEGLNGRYEHWMDLDLNLILFLQWCVPCK